MNSVVLIGRLVKDPEIKFTKDNKKVARFTLAINRPVGKDKEEQADFPRIVVFGKQAENCEKYLSKGKLAGVEGRIQTGNYKNEDNVTIYTTDIVANRVEFLSPKGKSDESVDDIPDGFEQIEDEGF